MIIRLDKIPDEGRIFKETRSAEWFTNIPEFAEGKNITLTALADIELRVELISNQVFIRGRVGVPVEVECARCLEKVNTVIEAPVDVALVPAEPGSEGEDAEDEGYGTYSGEEIDIAELLRGQVALHFPTRILCRPDCKGICPRCGADLNDEECRCSTESRDPRWAALDKLKL